jgi:hypothetical protein
MTDKEFGELLSPLKPEKEKIETLVNIGERIEKIRRRS